MTAVYALRRQQQARALVSLCVGVGQGVALALERELIRMATHLAGIVIERARAVEQLRVAKVAAEQRAQEIEERDREFAPEVRSVNRISAFSGALRPSVSDPPRL
jgi:hypothetical protein